jgi:hypothetical protein
MQPCPHDTHVSCAACVIPPPRGLATRVCRGCGMLRAFAPSGPERDYCFDCWGAKLEARAVPQPLGKPRHAPALPPWLRAVAGALLLLWLLGFLGARMRQEERELARARRAPDLVVDTPAFVLEPPAKKQPAHNKRATRRARE